MTWKGIPLCRSTYLMLFVEKREVYPSSNDWHFPAHLAGEDVASILSSFRSEVVQRESVS